jgi:hypothetical protein
LQDSNHSRTVGERTATTAGILVYGSITGILFASVVDVSDTTIQGTA